MVLMRVLLVAIVVKAAQQTVLELWVVLVSQARRLPVVVKAVPAAGRPQLEVQGQTVVMLQPLASVSVLAVLIQTVMLMVTTAVMQPRSVRVSVLDWPVQVLVQLEVIPVMQVASVLALA
ncbi:MAG TPA: hypothetical protein EYG12_08870 [Gammaproteobacteria bacterium]|nr:hypothetical protein [Gammaproteobacteria bacterium]